MQLSIGKIRRLIDYHKMHPLRTIAVVVLFIVYLPIVYQIHLDILASWVIVRADMGYPGLWWSSSGYSLFHIPFNLQWIGSGVFPMFTPLSPIEVWAYYNFVPNVARRFIWSLISSIIGLAYIIWPLLARPKKET